MLTELFTSKKFWVSLISAIPASWFAMHQSAVAYVIVALAAAYTIAQGVADHGKGAAAANAKTAEDIITAAKPVLENVLAAINTKPPTNPPS